MTNRDDLDIRTANLEEDEKTLRFVLKDAEYTVKQAKETITKTKRRTRAVNRELRKLQGKIA